MKKALVLAFSFSLILVGSAFAGEFGSPEPTAAPGKLSLGFGYFYYASKWKPDSSSLSGIPGVWSDAKVTQNQLYIQGSYAFTKNWEIYIRGGGADVRVKDAFSGLGDFDDDFRAFGSVGVRGLVYNGGWFGLGPFAQASIASSYKDKENFLIQSGGVLVPANVELKFKDLWDVNAGFGFFLKNQGISLYGGPFVYWAKATAEETVTTPSGSLSGTMDYEEKNHVGGFLGVRASLGSGFILQLEGQYKSNFSGGASLSYSF